MTIIRAPWRDTYRRAGLTGEALDYACVLRGDPCSYCGAPATCVDHIENVAHGGNRDDWTNLTAACAICNGSKNHRPLLGFMAELFALSSHDHLPDHARRAA